MRTPPDRYVKLAIAIGIVAIAVRFIGLNQPFIDNWSWRQSDVAAIARNFYGNGFHFAYPQIDWAGDQPGYVGTEFPILPFIAAISYQPLGVHEWIGRIQAVILFAASLPFFFLLARKFFGGTAAAWALFFYSFTPLHLMASRCFMPDVPSLSLAIIGLYFFQRWLEKGRAAAFWTAAIATSLAVLIKLPTIVIGVPMAYLAFDRFGASAYRRASLWIFATIALVPSLVWYWHAYRIAQEFYPHHFFGAGGIQIESFDWYWRVAKSTATSSLTLLLVVLATVGVWVTRAEARARLFQWWLATMLGFILLVGYGNRHPWYQLPLVPIAAAFAGAACAWMGGRLSGRRSAQIIGSAALVLMFALLAYSHAKTFYRESAADLRAAGLELKRLTAPGSLIVAADYGDPAVFYYAERRGWHFLEREGMYNGHPASSAEAITDLEKLRARGATHMVFYSGTLWWLDYYKEFAEHLSTTARLETEKPQFKIYQLNPARK